eukprot:CAMPEP_0196816358 /NCGR_PEP_ID=MMETSP1362-20130617/54905_1 /TAXON_ID=163516 /ORGANISM="Leptocylindrus danicus, Strain CCMP1856" /LENGTH=175 /DNA_ID=CAMNT_0042193655 /DNA_START=443 /DNA_END=970 /DNA_ORIENTATION=-
MDNFAPIGLAHFHLSEDDVDSAVHKPKVFHAPFTLARGCVPDNGFNEHMMAHENQVLKRGQGSLIERYFRSKRRQRKVRQRKSMKDNNTDTDDTSVTSLETACSLDAISSSMELMVIGDISVAKNSYVSILVEALEKKNETEAEIFIEKVHEFLLGGGLCSAVPNIVCHWDPKPN